MARIRFRPPGVKPGQKIGPLGPFRGRLGLHWVIAPIVVGAVLVVVGWYFLFRTSRPEAPWRPVAEVESLARGSARPALDHVFVGRSEDGRIFAVAEDPGCPLTIEGTRYLDCQGNLYGLAGVSAGGDALGVGDPLDLVPFQIYRGEIYVDPTRRIERGSRSAGPAREPPDPQPVVLTRDQGLGPPSCRPRAVGELVVGFMAAVNAGDAAAATDSFTSGLGWYSVTEGNPERDGRHFVAREPDKLRAYFTERAQLNERLRLVDLDVAYERDRNLGHIAYVLRRTADDLDRFGRWAHGKGAIDCDSGRIAVWSMAMAKGFNRRLAPPSCPIPDRRLANAAVVCSR